MAGSVYAVGGFNGSLRVRTVDVYDGVKDQWTSIASMQERRSTLGAAVLNDLLYAVGGFDGSTGRSLGRIQALPDLRRVLAEVLQGLQSFRAVPVPFLYGSVEKEPEMGFGVCCDWPCACSDLSVIAESLTLIISFSDTVLSASFSV